MNDLFPKREDGSKTIKPKNFLSSSLSLFSRKFFQKYFFLCNIVIGIVYTCSKVMVIYISPVFNDYIEHWPLCYCCHCPFLCFLLKILVPFTLIFIPTFFSFMKVTSFLGNILCTLNESVMSCNIAQYFQQ